jgi:hypothetical protein
VIGMELRHLRCFLAVAEELHFARAAERLHIEQSPLSRAIKELEEDLGTQLFVRTTRSTRLTLAGKLFLEHVPRVFTALQQARDSVKAAANGFHSQLRVALSDGIPPSRFSTFPGIGLRFQCTLHRCHDAPISISRDHLVFNIFLQQASNKCFFDLPSKWLVFSGASTFAKRILAGRPAHML